MIKLAREFSNRVIRAREHRLFWLLLFVTFLKGWLWAAAFPPFIHADELQHLGYARDVYRAGTMYIEPRGQFTPEEVIADDIVQVSAVSGLRQPVDLSPQRLAERNRLYQLLYDPAQQPPPETIIYGPGFARHHPPLYYGIQAVLAGLSKPGDLFIELAWGRLFSVLLSVAAVAFTYGLARELWPERPQFWLAAATVMSFLPMITYLGAVFSNQALEIPLFVAIFWLLIRITRQGLTWPLAFGLGLALGLGLLTKVSLLVAIPLITLVAIDDGWRRRTVSLAWVWVVLLPLVIAGPWYFDYIQGSRGTLGGSSETALGCPSLGVYLAGLPWGAVARTMWTESMAAFGIRDTFFPNWLNQLTVLALAVAGLGWGRRMVGAWVGRDKAWTWPRERWLGMGLLFLAWIGIHAFVLLIGFLLSCGDVDAYAAASGVTRNSLAFAIGRLVIPGAAAPLSILLLTGWLALAKGYDRWVLPLAGLLLIALNSYALGDRVVGRYYGLQPFVTEGQRQVLSAPLTPTHTVGECVVVPPTELARVDVWLQKGQSSPNGTLYLTIHDAVGGTIEQTEAFRLGGLTTFPAYVTLPSLAVMGEVCLTLHGEFGESVQVWAAEGADGLWYDGTEARQGRLALRLYEPVPWTMMAERLAAASLFVYPTAFYHWIGLLYGLTLLFFCFSGATNIKEGR